VGGCGSAEESPELRASGGEGCTETTKCRACSFANIADRGGGSRASQARSSASGPLDSGDDGVAIDFFSWPQRLFMS
jgi:hypothetical protein